MEHKKCTSKTTKMLAKVPVNVLKNKVVPHQLTLSNKQASTKLGNLGWMDLK